MQLNDINNIKLVLKQERIWPNKRLGQNFLIDQKALKSIVASAQIKADDMIVEIGPGVGTLTQELSKRANLVLAIEKDRKLTEWLRRYFKSQSDKVKIVCDDILQYDIAKINSNNPSASLRAGKTQIFSETQNLKLKTNRCHPEQCEGSCIDIDSSPSVQDDNSYGLGLKAYSSYKVVSNLPYNITSPVIRKFIDSDNPPSVMVLMVQKEVAKRICAKPGTRQRGLLTVIVEYFGKAEIIEIVPRTSFYPVPDVDSAIIRIKEQGVRTKKINYKSFLNTIKIGFSQKRRQIHHALKAGLHLSKDKVLEILNKAKIDPTKRAEELDLDSWVRLKEQIVQILDKQ